MRRLTADRRGAVMPLVCVLITVLVGCAALALDLGRLRYVATEAQAAADAAALAAASATQINPNTDAQNAPARARDLASRNRAAGAAGSVATADVVPVVYDPDARTATATVWSGSANGAQVTARARPSYAFAGILDLAPPAVPRAATAWIGNLTEAACVRPFALPYTRIYEDLYTGNRRYTGKTDYAPNLTQADVAALAPQYSVSATRRTFVVLPPSEDEVEWDDKGKPNTGAWHTVNFANNGYTAFTTYLAAPVGSGACKPATTEVGDYLRPFSWNRSNFEKEVLAAANPGFVALCNRAGSAPDARCRDARGHVGVETRAAFSDSIPNSSGPFSQKVRMISQVRVMCYFMTDDDVCAATPILTPDGKTTPWQMPSNRSGGPPVDKGYPKGTIVVLLDGPVSVDITPDAKFGNTISFTQRLLLVK